MKRNHENWLTAYLRYTTNTEAPTAFHWWTGVATIAGALQRNVYLDMHNFEWIPNFYIVLVGQAGLVTKSTSLRLGEKLLRGVGPKIRFGSSSGSWQAMAEEISKAALTSASKKGSLLEAETFRTSPISYFISEFGTFFDPNNREQIDFFVDAWDGQRTSFTRTTKSGGSLKIDCACVNILAGTTPTWIKENFTATMIGGGFASRLIFVKGSEKRKFIAYPSRHATTEDFKRMQMSLTEDLKQINKLEGPMSMTEEAYRWGENWYEEHFKKKRQLSGERFDGFYARKQTHLHKLAIILSIARSNSLVIEVEDLQEANDRLLLVEKDLASVVENVTSKQISATHKREILSIIAGEGEIAQEDLYEQVFVMMSGPDFDKALSDLAKANQITTTSKAGKGYLKLRRPPLRVIGDK